MSDESWVGYDKNPYYSPEECGLKVVGLLEDQNADYSYDSILVVQDIETGKLYAAHDSGCSCPTPFEDIKGLGDMVEIQSELDMRAFVEMEESEYSQKWVHGDRFDLYRKVRTELNVTKAVGVSG